MVFILMADNQNAIAAIIVGAKYLVSMDSRNATSALRAAAATERSASERARDTCYDRVSWNGKAVLMLGQT